MTAASARIQIYGGSVKWRESPTNEDAWKVFPRERCAIVLDGESRARGAAKRGVEQFERLLRDQPPMSAPDWVRIAKALDAYLIGGARSTFAGFR